MPMHCIDVYVEIIKQQCGMDILFISHVRILREALVAMLQSDDGNRAFAACSRGTVDTAVSACMPQVLTVDVSHPDGMSLVATVRAHAPKVSVIILAMRDHDEEFLAWADLGIAGYVGPDTTASDLLSTVRRASPGEVTCPPRPTALLLNRFATRPADRTSRAAKHALTAREQEIAALLADGLSNKLIARRLSCALPTVKNHVHSIIDKWDVRSLWEAAARVRRQRQDGEPDNAELTAVRASHMSQMGGSTLRNCGMPHRLSSPAPRNGAQGMTLMVRAGHSGQRS